MNSLDGDRTSVKGLVYDPISDRFIDLDVDDLHPIIARSGSLESGATAVALAPQGEADGT